MKTITLLILLLTSTISLAIQSDKTSVYSTPYALMKAFIEPLKKGKEGLVDAAGVGSNSMINGSSMQYVDEQMTKQGNGSNEPNSMDKLSYAMKDDGKLQDIKLIDKDDTKLNGIVQKYTYELHFSNGSSSTVEFNMIQPTKTSGFLFTNIKVK